MFISICISLSLYIYIYIYVSICKHIYIYIYISIYIYIYICISPTSWTVVRIVHSACSDLDVLRFCHAVAFYPQLIFIHINK